MKLIKKFATVLCMLVLCSCFIFAGCSPKLEMPENTLEVYSNGGSVVRVGDYVYFANTYVLASSLSGDDNKESTVEHNGIYRVKTQNNKTVRNEDGELQNLQEVYKKIAGYETSNMFVVGDYLYFTSPNTHKKAETMEDMFTLSSLFRIKLDGTNFKEILTTQTTAGTFYLDKDNKLYIFDNNEISAIKLDGNTIGKRETLVSEVENAVFPDSYGEQVSVIYYTQSLTNDDGSEAGVTGNKLKKYDVASKQSSAIRQINGETIALLKVKQDRVYYTRTDINGEAVIFSNNFVNGFENSEQQHTFVADETINTSFFPVGSDENGNALPVFYEYNSKLYLDYEVVVDEDVTVNFVDGDYVYYSTANGLFRISYKDKAIKQLSDKKDIASADFDFDGRYVYFYAYTDTNSSDTYYMFRADTKSTSMTTEEISSILEKDLVESDSEEKE